MLFFPSTLSPATHRGAILEKLLYPTEFIPYHFQFSFCYLYPPLPKEKPSFHSLSAPREEFPEPPPSTRIILTSGYELFPGLITLVRKPSFSGLESENPYHHLSDFEHVCSLFAIAGMTQDTLKWKLFPFSLIGKAEQWYTYTVGSVHDNWEELRDKFYLEFFPMSRIIALHRDIRYFKQNERESIRAAWYRFLSLIESGPVLSIP